jgi:hypothetical protein
MAGKTVTVTGGNFYALAAALLGDATQAYRLAQANGNAVDFFLQGTHVVKVPDVDPTQQDGVPAQ